MCAKKLEQKNIILHCLDAIFKSENALNSTAPDPDGELTLLLQTP